MEIHVLASSPMARVAGSVTGSERCSSMTAPRFDDDRLCFAKVPGDSMDTHGVVMAVQLSSTPYVVRRQRTKKVET